VCWLAVLDELLQSESAGVDAGGTLHSMDAANQVKGVNNQ